MSHRPCLSAALFRTKPDGTSGSTCGELFRGRGGDRAAVFVDFGFDGDLDRATVGGGFGAPRANDATLVGEGCFGGLHGSLASGHDGTGDIAGHGTGDRSDGVTDGGAGLLGIREPRLGRLSCATCSQREPEKRARRR